MFSRLISLPVVIGAAVGIPYLATHGPNIDGLLHSISSPGDTAAALPKQIPPGRARPPALQGPGATLYPTETPLEGLPTLALHEVFDMNISKEWVYQRWARKSTALSELGWFGIRVPLVTGTQLHDLAGSITYFFGTDGRVNRISFHGTTGDTSQLVMLAVQQFGLQQQSTPVAAEQLFQIRRQNQVFSELRTRPAPVLWASSPHDSFAVDLDLQRPDVTTPLPSRLPPLPIVKAPAAEQLAATAAPQSAQPDTKSTANSGNAAKPADPGAMWKPFFPRSRVSDQQVDNLDRRNGVW